MVRRRSNAAKDKFDSHIGKLDALDERLTNAITFYNNAYNTVVSAKNEIIGISEDAQDQIDDMLNSDTNDEAGRQAQIEGIVSKAFMRNSGVVTQHGGGLSPTDPSSDPGPSRQQRTYRPGASPTLRASNALSAHASSRRKHGPPKASEML